MSGLRVAEKRAQNADRLLLYACLGEIRSKPFSPKKDQHAAKALFRERYQREPPRRW